MGKKLVVVVFGALALLALCAYVVWRVHRPWSLRHSVLDYAWASAPVEPKYQCHYKLHIAPDHSATVTYWEETRGDVPQVWSFRMTDAAYDALVNRLDADGLLRTPEPGSGETSVGGSWNELRVTQGARSMTVAGESNDAYEAMRQAIPEKIFTRMPLAQR